MHDDGLSCVRENLSSPFKSVIKMSPVRSDLYVSLSPSSSRQPKRPRVLSDASDDDVGQSPHKRFHGAANGNSSSSSNGTSSFTPALPPEVMEDRLRRLQKAYPNKVRNYLEIEEIGSLASLLSFFFLPRPSGRHRGTGCPPPK